MSRDRITVVDVAEAAGVSKSTVSLVLQASPLVNEATGCSGRMNRPGKP